MVVDKRNRYIAYSVVYGWMRRPLDTNNCSASPSFQFSQLITRVNHLISFQLNWHLPFFFSAVATDARCGWMNDIVWGQEVKIAGRRRSVWTNLVSAKQTICIQTRKWRFFFRSKMSQSIYHQTNPALIPRHKNDCQSHCFATEKNPKNYESIVSSLSPYSYEFSFSHSKTKRRLTMVSNAVAVRRLGSYIPHSPGYTLILIEFEIVIRPVLLRRKLLGMGEEEMRADENRHCASIIWIQLDYLLFSLGIWNE